MPYDYSQAWKEAVASVNSTVAFVDTISFSHASFPSTYRYARSDTDLIIQGTTYKGKQFYMSLPEIKAGVTTGINITISNVTSEIINIFKKANQSKTPILVDLKSFVPNQITMTASFATKLYVKSLGFNKSDMSMTAGYPDSTNMKLPKEKYTTRECPGLRQ
jgi:hypothetical protein